MAASLDFDGTNGYIDCGNISAMENQSEMSFSFHVNFDVIDPPGSNVLMQQGAGNLSTYRFLNWDNGDGKLILEVSDGGAYGFGGAWFDLSTLNTGQWYHIVFTWQSNGAVNITKAYVDSVAQSMTNVGAQFQGNSNTTGLNHEIGRQTNGARYFNGKLSYIELFNRLLSVSEISELYKKPGSVVNGRTAYWPLTTTACKDLSGNGNDGTLTGGVTASDLGPPVYFPDPQTT